MPIRCGQFDYLRWLRASRLFDLFQAVQTYAKIGSGFGGECVDVKEVSILITPAKLPVSPGFQPGDVKHNSRSRIVTKIPLRLAKMLDEQGSAFCIQFLFSDSDKPITHSTGA